MKFGFEVDNEAERQFEEYLESNFSSKFDFSYELFVRHYINDVVVYIMKPLVSDFDKDFLRGKYSGRFIESDLSYEIESLLVCYMYSEFDLSHYFFELLLFLYSEKYGSFVRKNMKGLLV
jgi:hypothetical protein